MKDESPNSSDFQQKLMVLLLDQAGTRISVAAWIRAIMNDPFNITSGQSLIDFISNCTSVDDTELMFISTPRIPGLSPRMTAKLIFENQSIFQSLIRQKLSELLTAKCISRPNINAFFSNLDGANITDWDQFIQKFAQCKTSNDLMLALMRENLFEGVENLYSEPIAKSVFLKLRQQVCESFKVEIRALANQASSDYHQYLIAVIVNLTLNLFNIETWDDLNQSFKDYNNTDDFYAFLVSRGVFDVACYVGAQQIPQGQLKTNIDRRFASDLLRELCRRYGRQLRETIPPVSSNQATSTETRATTAVTGNANTRSPFNFVAELRSLFAPTIGDSPASYLAGKLCGVPLCFQSWEAVDVGTSSLKTSRDFYDFFVQMGMFPQERESQTKQYQKIATILFEEVRRRFPKAPPLSAANLFQPTGSTSLPQPHTPVIAAPSDEVFLEDLCEKLSETTGQPAMCSQLRDALAGVPLKINSFARYMEVFGRLSQVKIQTLLTRIIDIDGFDYSIVAEHIFKSLHPEPPAKAEVSVASGGLFAPARTASAPEVMQFFEGILAGMEFENNALVSAFMQLHSNLISQNKTTLEDLRGVVAHCRTALELRSKFADLELFHGVDPNVRARVVELIFNSTLMTKPLACPQA